MPRNFFASRLFTFLSIIAFCFLLLMLNPQNIFSPVRNFLFTIFYPFEKIYYYSGTKIRDTLDFVGSISKLRDENEKLIRENISLEAKLATLGDEHKENEFLRSQLGLIPKDKFQLESSFVLLLR